MKILGIDPGYERLGIAVLEKKSGEAEQVLFSECFKTKPSLPFSERLNLIGGRVGEVIKKYRPDIMSVETLFLNTNQKTAMRVSEARGVILYEGAKAGVVVFEASPPQIKTAVTGYGQANKEGVMKMVKMLLKIDKNKTSDDELDAIASAITAITYNKN